MRSHRECEADVERALCPACGSANAMRVLAQVWTRAWVEPTYPEPRVETMVESEPTWNANAPCECECCGYNGTAQEFVGASSVEAGSCYDPNEERTPDYWRTKADPTTDEWT